MPNRAKGLRLRLRERKGRPAVYVICDGDRNGRNAAAVILYRWWLTANWRRLKKDNRDFWEKEVMTIKAGTLPPTVEEVRRELGGKNLACWCRQGEACHADVLLEIANASHPHHDRGDDGK